MKTLNINEKTDVSYCIPTSLRDEHIKINITKVKNRIQPEEIREDHIAIVCYAPSLNDTWEEIKKFKYVMTCSGAHRFLVERGIIPTWHVDLEPREYKIKLLGEPQKETKYLIASTIHPRYLDSLNGFDVKLWHIFANEGEAASVLPRGEWALTGGSSVGLRCMTLARFFGFRNMHIFGMDGNFRDGGATHTAEHPNAPRVENFFTTEYGGRTFLTNPSLLHCAKETFHELNQMPDVKAVFYGDGLVQVLAKDYVPAPFAVANIAYSKPALISEEYKELNWKLHRDNPGFGMGGAKHKDVVIKLSQELKTNSILDYGCGKGMLGRELPFPIWEYDPAIPEKSAMANPADIVVCTDVLEHIELDKLTFVLDDLRRCVKKVGYFVISTRQAVKTYANGKNTHSIVQGKDWWSKKLSRYFDIGTAIEKGNELQVVVGPKTKQDVGAVGKIVELEHAGNKIKFNVPNETIGWRCETLFKKEPITVKWIDSFKKGEIMIDVGANMGGYSMLASKMGVKVIAFEPESENYALLQKNILLNGSDAVAYCAAVTDKNGIDKLYLSQVGVGGSCHTFGGSNERNISQGCVGLRLDDLNIKADHIKIDVDGQEYKVIAGAEKLLMNGVKSVLIEVNTNLSTHVDMVNKMLEMGYEFDQVQVDAAKRKDGPFKGVAEYLFTKSIGKYISSGIDKTKLSVAPYPHIYVENFFSESVYRDIIKSMPEKYEEIEKTRGTRGYPKRFTATPSEPFWTDLYNQLTSGHLKKSLCNKFGIEDRGFAEDILLVRDNPGYAIPPHTDSLNKIITVLIYLPEDDSFQGEGTSIFVPKRKGFVCNKGSHYDFDDFRKIKTMPFKPNSMFAFARTNNSFHGVEPCEHVRNVLLYNIKVK